MYVCVCGMDVWLNVLRKVNAYAARRQKNFYCLLLSVLSLYFSSARVAFAFIYHLTFMILWLGWAEIFYNIYYIAILSYIEQKMEININRRTRDIIALVSYTMLQVEALYIISFPRLWSEYGKQHFKIHNWK